MTNIKAKGNGKYTNWSFTLNNYTEDEVKSINEADAVYIIYGREHPDTTPHLQGYIQFKHQKRLNEVKKALGTQRLHLEASQGTAEQNIAYCSKEDTNPFIKGEPKRQTKPVRHTNDEVFIDAIQLAQDGNIDEAQELVRNTAPLQYLINSTKINDTLNTLNKTRIKYDLPDMSSENNKLKPQQQKVWDLLQQTPKQRRIIWVTGNYGSGKSYLYNYIKENHPYAMYDAGQTASLDNIAYGYDEEGVIAWDLPRTFNFTELGNPIASVIEKFSDFGQTITSKKYAGKTQKVRGHALVFSNAPPLEQLQHRDIIHIDLSKEDEVYEPIRDHEEQELQLKTPP
uniref:hypothetical protein n=1 Tax=Polynucleobacter sp. TaxID=2029855 RepID=UPI004047E340